MIMNNRRTFLMLLAAAALLPACEKNAVQDITAPAATGARVRFFNFGLNAPGVNFYANDRKVTAISSATGTESTVGVNFGGVASGGNYSVLPAGQYALSGRIAAATDKDVPIANVSANLAAGKNYSFFLAGPYDATAKTSDAFVVEDVFPDAIDYTVAYVRFVNAIHNSQPMTLYARNTVTGEEVALGSAVAYKSGGEFVKLASGSYDLFTRAAGSTANIISRTAVAFGAGRVYTIGARGDMTVVSTTAANRPFLDNTANR